MRRNKYVLDEILCTLFTGVPIAWKRTILYVLTQHTLTKSYPISHMSICIYIFMFLFSFSMMPISYCVSCI